MSNSFRLGIWGTSESGKTTYLTMLFRSLQQQGWRVNAYGKAREFYNKNIELIEKGMFPEPTETKTSEALEIYSYYLNYENPSQRKSKVELVLDFFDIGGENYEFYRNREEIKITLDNRELSLIEYFLSCHGILFLLDNWRDKKIHEEEKTQFRLLEELFQDMQERQYEINISNGQEINLNILEPYVAFVVTKVDHKDILQLGKSSVELVRRILGASASPNWFHSYFQVDRNKLLRQINDGEYQKPSRFHRCQFFSVSAIGVYHDKTTKQWKSGVTEPQNEDINSQNPGNTYNKPDSLFGDISVRDIPIESSSRSDQFFSNEPPDNFDEGPKISIKSEETLKPINVTKPIEWFIQGMKIHKPILPTIPKASKSSKSSTMEE